MTRLQVAVAAIAAATTACTVGGDDGTPGELTCNTSAQYSDCSAEPGPGGVNVRPGYCAAPGVCAVACDAAVSCTDWMFVWLGRGTQQSPIVEICYCLDENPGFWDDNTKREKETP